MAVWRFLSAKYKRIPLDYIFGLHRRKTRTVGSRVRKINFTILFLFFFLPTQEKLHANWFRVLGRNYGRLLSRKWNKTDAQSLLSRAKSRRHGLTGRKGTRASMNKEIELFASLASVNFLSGVPLSFPSSLFLPAVLAYKNKQPPFPRRRKREFLITGNFVQPRYA